MADHLSISLGLVQLHVTFSMQLCVVSRFCLGRKSQTPNSVLQLYSVFQLHHFSEVNLGHTAILSAAEVHIKLFPSEIHGFCW